MARTTIYIPEELYVDLLKVQKNERLTFSGLCSKAFKIYLRQKRKEAESAMSDEQ
jgi:predicted CopG family antitoxin